jgi:hypothetical protein
MNAFKHGLRATDELFVQHLDPKERKSFEDFRSSLHKEYDPQTVEEKLVIDRIAIQNFRLMRLYHFEYLAANKSKAHPLAPESVIPHLDRYARYDRQLGSQLRSLHNQLRSLYIRRGDFSLTMLSNGN